jgi:hypothetical protein
LVRFNRDDISTRADQFGEADGMDANIGADIDASVSRSYQIFEHFSQMPFIGSEGP